MFSQAHHISGLYIATENSQNTANQSEPWGRGDVRITNVRCIIFGWGWTRTLRGTLHEFHLICDVSRVCPFVYHARQWRIPASFSFCSSHDTCASTRGAGVYTHRNYTEDTNTCVNAATVNYDTVTVQRKTNRAQAWSVLECGQICQPWPVHWQIWPLSEHICQYLNTK